MRHRKAETKICEVNKVWRNSLSMGKGRGGCCSCDETSIVTSVLAEPGSGILSSSSSVRTSPPWPAPAPAPARQKLKIYIVYYSLFGHTAQLARKIKEGVDGVSGVEAYLFQVPEILTPEVLLKMQAPEKDSTVPVIAPEQMEEADGLIFGFPTRFGSMAAQMKQFFDSTGQLWKHQKLAGKPAGLFVSTGSQGGGQESTAWTAVTQLAHHGMLFVPIGYKFGERMCNIDEPRGGSPYGAGTFTGNGLRVPTPLEFELAEFQGRHTAEVVKRLGSDKVGSDDCISAMCSAMCACVCTGRRLDY